MKRFFGVIVLWLCVLVVAVPVEAAEVKAHETLIEAGGAVISHGQGAISMATMDSKAACGYQLGVTYAFTDKLSVKYGLGNFVSEKEKFMGFSADSCAHTDHIDLVQKIDEHVDLYVGWEHNKFTYSDYATQESQSSFLAGAEVHADVDDRTRLYAEYLRGRNIIISEFGIKYDFSPVSSVNLFYAKHEVDDVDVGVEAGPILMKTQVDYNMSGLVVMYGIKL